jgi:hypothetical protein
LLWEEECEIRRWSNSRREIVCHTCRPSSRTQAHAGDKGREANARPSGDTVFEHLMGMGNQSGPLGLSVFESSTRPWFQFLAAPGTGRLTLELAERQLVFVRDLPSLATRENATEACVRMLIPIWQRLQAHAREHRGRGGSLMA